MALDDLADVSDLSARGITTTSLHTLMLAVASSLVRQAAGSPIAENESTVTLTGWGEKALALPGKPIREVSAVTLDGETVADWKLTSGGTLWRLCGWGCSMFPADVEVTMTHGLTTVPAHIVQLVCDLAILGAKTATEGAIDPNVLVESIDDYKVTFAAAGEQVASAMTVPPATVRSLRAQFGGGVVVASYR